MHELRAGRMIFCEIEGLEQRKLLEHHRALTPRARRVDREAAIVVAQRRFDMGLPARHVISREHAVVRLAGRIHARTRAAEAVDGLGNKNLRPEYPRRLAISNAGT